LFTILVLLALVSGLAMGRSFLGVSSTHVQASTTVTPAGKKAVVPPAQASRPTATATAKPAPKQPTATPLPTATTAPVPAPTQAPPVSGGLPSLAGSYSGSVTDQITTPPTSAGLTLSQVAQNTATISGYATISSPLQGGNSFTGTVASGGVISFLVNSVAGNLPLYFNGQIASNGSMSGYYCSYRNGACDRASGGYGVWSAAP